MSVSPANSGVVLINGAAPSRYPYSTYSILKNTVLTLQAQPDGLNRFAGWTVNGATTTANPLQVVHDKDRNVLARFQVRSGRVHGRAFKDVNANGQWEATEPALDGVGVELVENNAGILQGVTSGAGEYEFILDRPGTFQVAFTAPAGHYPSPTGPDSPPDPQTGLSPLFDLTGNNLSQAVDAGFFPAPEEVSPAQARGMADTLENLVVVDIRKEEDFCAGHIANAVNLPKGTADWEAFAHTLTPGVPVLVVDQVGIIDATDPRYGSIDVVSMSGGLILEDAFQVFQNSGLDAHLLESGMDGWAWPVQACGEAYPLAECGPNRNVLEGTSVHLDPSGSTMHHIQAVEWTQVRGPAVALSSANDWAPGFVAPAVLPGVPVELEFELAVTAVSGGQHADRVVITVSDNGITGFPANALSFFSATGEPMAFTATGGRVVRLVSVGAGQISGGANRPASIPLGLLDLAIKTDAPGGRAELALLFSGPMAPGLSWRKYHEASATWTDYASHAQWDADRKRLVVQFVDGGFGDDDGRADGLITDPGGPASALVVPAQAAGSGEGEGSGGGCFIRTAGKQR